MKKFLLLLFLSVLTMSCKSDFKSDTLSPKIKYLSTCEVTKNPSVYEKNVVNMIGEIKGYHQIILFNETCPNDENLILLNLDDSTYSLLLEQSASIRNNPGRKNSDITGELYFQGKIEIKKGKISDYGERIENIKTGEILQKTRDVEAVQISNIEIHQFIPN